MDASVQLLSSRVSLFIFVFQCCMLFNLSSNRIPSFLAHARKSKFFSSRVEKKIAVPKFGDVFIGSNDKAAPKANGCADLFDPCDPFAAIAPTRPLLGKTLPVGETLPREEVKKKYEFNEKDLVEPFLATYLDVAVIRCLFTSQWIEEGVEWALNYIYRRLETISKYKKKQKETLYRSNSLPTPKRKNEDKLLEKPESKTCRPKSDNENTISTRDNSQLKTSSFQELRRSSFSGLPGILEFLLTIAVLC